MSKTRIEISNNNFYLNKIMEHYNFNNKTQAVRFILQHFQDLQQENKSLINENMCLQLKLKMLKNDLKLPKNQLRLKLP